MIIPEKTADLLRRLADAYENETFYDRDPCRVLKRYQNPADIEAAAFIAAMLSFGRRDLFLRKIDILLETADAAGGPVRWLTSAIPARCPVTNYEVLHDRNYSFYRFYSYKDMDTLFDRLGDILRDYGSLETAVKNLYEYGCCCEKKFQLDRVLSQLFTGIRPVPQGKHSANKRIHMFLRWMVRKNSPVDSGLWDWYPARDLIIPLDTHVLRQAVFLGLLPDNASATDSTARYLTELLRQIWPDDPCRGDYALFGLGINGGAVDSTRFTPVH